MTKKQSRLRGFRIWIGIVLILGIWFRFAHLDQKPYWQDETYTLLRLSGYSLTEANQRLYTGQKINVTDIQRYQQLSPNTNAIDTIQRLAEEVPQHPPLYFVMARFWAQIWSPWFGDSAATVRSFSAVISLFGFPAIYWLGRELFDSPLVGWMAMGLFAVSPIYIRYAQEARPYSLWIVLVLLSSAALLQAIRNPNWRNWGIYAVATAAACYCHLLSGFVILGHGIYSLTVAQCRFSKMLQSYLIASLLGVALFLPWLGIVWTNWENAVQTTRWVDLPLPLSSLVVTWGLHLCQAFVAWHFKYNSLLIYLAIPLTFLVAYAVINLVRQTSEQTWLFVVALISIPILILIIPDLIWTGRRSVNIRYFLSSLLGIHLAVAWLLIAQLTQTMIRSVQLRVWQLITVLLISGGVVTGIISAQADTWWGWSEYDVEIGKIINQSSNPIVISDMPIGVVLPLSHRLKPQTNLLLLTEPETLKLPDGFSRVYVYNPSERFQFSLKQQGIVPKLIYQFKDDSFQFSLYAIDS